MYFTNAISIPVGPVSAACSVVHGPHEHRDLPDPARRQARLPDRARRDRPPPGSSRPADGHHPHPAAQRSHRGRQGQGRDQTLDLGEGIRHLTLGRIRHLTLGKESDT